MLLGQQLKPKPPQHSVIPVNLLQRALPEIRRRFVRMVEKLRESGLGIYEEEWPEVEDFDRLQSEQGLLVLAEIAQSLKPVLEHLQPAASAQIMELLAPYQEVNRAQLTRLNQGLKQLRLALANKAPALLPTLPCPVPLLNTASPSLGSLTRFSNLFAHHSLSLPFQGGSLLVSGANLQELMGIVDLVGGLEGHG